MTRPSGRWVSDGRPEHLREACEGSLKRLKVERIDLYQTAEEDQRLAREGLVELMDEEGHIYHKHIDELDPWDVADRIRADTARSDWLAMRTQQRIERREARRLWGPSRPSL